MNEPGYRNATPSESSSYPPFKSCRIEKEKAAAARETD